MNIETVKLDNEQQHLKGRYIDHNNLSPEVAHALAFMQGMECDGGGATISDPLKHVQCSISGQMVLRSILGGNDSDKLIYDFFISF